MIKLWRYKCHNGHSRPAIFECERAEFHDLKDLDNFRSFLAAKLETEKSNITFDYELSEKMK